MVTEKLPEARSRQRRGDAAQLQHLRQHEEHDQAAIRVNRDETRRSLGLHRAIHTGKLPKTDPPSQAGNTGASRSGASATPDGVGKARGVWFARRGPE